MEEKLYKNKEWMHEHYVIQEESTPVMAKIAGCSNKTIWRWLRRFEIPNAREFQPYRNEAWLREHYIDLQESTYAMAQQADCNYETIRYWIHKFDIPVRTRSEGIFLATRNYLTISQELLDLLEGELLGDGYVGMRSLRSARYTHTSKYREYVEWLSREFSDLGLEQVGKINRYDGVSKGKSYMMYCYASRDYPELVPIREKWYPEGSRKKIVPKDLKLNSLICRQWYIGDGGFHNLAAGRPDIVFSTNDFDKASIDYLLKELRGKGFKVTHQPSHNKIGMSVKSVKDFLEYIGPCPIDCYQYKWDYQDNRKRAKNRFIG